jgi:hypothetical protein
MYTVLSQNGKISATGYTPASFTVTNGQYYTVTVDNYGNYYFGYWLDTGSTNPSRTFTTVSSLSLTAVYCVGPCSPPPPPPGQSTISINTANSAGQPIAGYYITLWQNGVQIASCYSQCSFTVNNGQTYQVAAAGYGAEAFNHWQNDGSTGFETVNVPTTSSSINLTAVYSP